MADAAKPSYEVVTAIDLPGLQAAMQEMVTTATSEQTQTAKALQGVQEMFSQASQALTGQSGIMPVFISRTNTLLGRWKSPADGELFNQYRNQSVQSMADAVPQLEQPGPAVQSAVIGIGMTKADVDKNAEAFNAAIAQYNAKLTAGSPFMSTGAQGVMANRPWTAEEQKALLDSLIKQLRPLVEDSGRALTALGQTYQAVAAEVTAATANLKWVGPKAANPDVAVKSAPGPGSAPQQKGPGQKPRGSEKQGGGEQKGGGGAGGQQGGGAAGGDQAGGGAAGGDQAGGASGGDQSGDQGQQPGGGTGLAGNPVTVPPVQLPVPQPGPPAVPPPWTTPGPDAGIPLPTPLPSAKDPLGLGNGKFPGLGGGGGGGGIGGGIPNARGIGEGIGGGGKAVGKPIPKSDQNIAQAARNLTAGPESTTGQAPSLAGGPATGGGQTSTGGGGGMPPMMPPGTAGAGGGGTGPSTGGRPGTGAARPGGPGRVRADAPTPGVPAGLRGRSATADSGRTSVSTDRQRQREGAETLQMLDEELWTVDDPAAAAKRSETRRPAR
ncbi:hypothetical protein [Kribbella sp. NPDC055071]